MGFTRRRKSYRGGNGSNKPSTKPASDLHGALKQLVGGRRRASYRLRGGRRMRSRRLQGGRRTRTRRGGRRRRRGGSLGTAVLPFALVGVQEAYARSLKRKRGRR